MCLVAVWRSGSALVSINEVNLRRVWLVVGWVTGPGSTLCAGNLSQYITSYPGQLSLANPPWVGAMNTSQRAMMLFGWRVKADRTMVRAWVAGKTV